MTQPVLVSTWDHGLAANRAGWQHLLAPGISRAIDAVEAAIRNAEADPDVRSVGRGGYPDRAGHVTLDAAIMDHAYHAGAVAALDGIVHAIGVARAVMEQTEHVMLTGAGALEFAIANGFARESLVVAETMRRFEEKQGGERPNFENHDTIVTLGLDADGRLAGGCSTSGLMNRLPGRVGDSPIIGAGLYVDGEVGAAGATGHGELALRVSASALVVERMRSGASPQQACDSVIDLIRTRLRPSDEMQLAVIALDRDGTIAASALQSGFSYAVSRGGTHELVSVE